MKGDIIKRDCLLMVFVKNPELGKVKTRLAKTLGDQKALDVYKSLLQHTRLVAAGVNADKAVFYHEHVEETDLWSDPDFIKCLQRGDHLGEKMLNAFELSFHEEYQQVVIIGSDCFEINAGIIDYAFKALRTNDVVLGPASDGGYYLLGMKRLHKSLFHNKRWSGKDVLLDTVIDLKTEGLTYELLDTLSDVDVATDLHTMEGKF